MEDLPRIKKAIAYFKGLKPSQINAGHLLHFKVFCDLVEGYVNDTEEQPKKNGQKGLINYAEKLFNEAPVTT